MAPSVSITSPSNTSTFNEGQTVNFIANASSAIGITKVEFYNGSTLVGSDGTSSYTYSTSSLVVGTHSFSAKSFTSCGKASTSVPVSITIKRAVVSNEPITGPSCGSANQSLTFALNAAQQVNATDHNWWFSGATESITPSASKTSCVVKTNQYFTSGKICVGVNLNSAPYYSQYCKDVSACNTRIGSGGISETEALSNSISIYPNPSVNKDYILVDVCSGIIPSIIQIINTIGRLEIDVYPTDSKTYIPTSGLAQGTYFVKLFFEGKTVSKKLIIIK